MARVFISYRRDDARYPAERIYGALRKHLNASEIFIDVDSIRLGTNYVQHLSTKVAECEIFLCLIGKGWLTAFDERTGERRLDDPNDFVRIEVASALAQEKSVVPVLLDGARIPEVSELPEDLAGLVERQSAFVSHRTFGVDVQRLINNLDLSESRPRGRIRGPVIVGGVAVLTLLLAIGWWTVTNSAVDKSSAEGAERRLSAASTAVEAATTFSEPRAAPNAVSPPPPSQTPLLDARSTPASTRAPVVATPSRLPDFALFRDCEVCPEMVLLPPGSFQMGSPPLLAGRFHDEGPRHAVSIAAFAVSRFEISQYEFEQFVSERELEPGWGCYAFDGVKWVLRPGLSWDNPGYRTGSRHPVSCVNWQDARSYVQWLSEETGHDYRLLTEAEWEYAATSGGKQPDGAPDGVSVHCDISNLSDQSRGAHTACNDGFANTTAPVGSFRGNAFGLYDMLGNVWEWVEDCYTLDYSEASQDGTANRNDTCERRSMRGGAWIDRASAVRTTLRNSDAPETRSNHLGFRIARAQP